MAALKIVEPFSFGIYIHKYVMYVRGCIYVTIYMYMHNSPLGLLRFLHFSPIFPDTSKKNIKKHIFTTAITSSKGKQTSPPAFHRSHSRYTEESQQTRRMRDAVVSMNGVVEEKHTEASNYCEFDGKNQFKWTIAYKPIPFQNYNYPP